MSGRKTQRFRAAVSATMAAMAVVTGLALPARAAGSLEVGLEAEVDVGLDLSVDLGEVLDVLTYKVHTVLEDGDTVIERTVPAAVGVPRPVNVDRGLLPDLIVEIRPDPPDLISVIFTRTPTALGRLRLLAEVIVDIPGNIGASFGYDARQGNAPPRFKTGLTLTPGGDVNLDVTAETSQPSSTPTLGVVAEVFGKDEAGGGKVDAKTARLDLTPVPGEVHLGVSADNAAGSFDVEVDTSTPTTAAVRATNARGAKAQEVTGVVDQLPERVTVSFSEQGDEQKIIYRASDVIGHVGADLFERNAGEITQHVAARLDTVPAEVDVTIAGTRTELVANQAVGTAEVGFNRVVDPPFEQGVTQPAYVVADLDTLNGIDTDGDGKPEPLLRRAAVRVPGVTSVVADTGDPLVIDTVSAGGALLAKVRDTRRTGQFTVDATVDALPADVRVEVSAKAGTISYEGGAQIDSIKAVIQEPDGLGAPGVGGARLHKADVLVQTIPGSIDLAFFAGARDDDGDGVDDPPTDTDGDGDLTDEGKNLLARLDTGGPSIGEVTALLTSGPNFPNLGLDRTPDGKIVEDGVVIEDLKDHYVVQAHVTGLRRIEAVKGGPVEDRPGEADATPVISLDVDVTSTGNFRARLERQNGDDADEITAGIFELAPALHAELFQIFGDVPCEGGPQNIQCLPDANGDGLIDAIPCEVAGNGCALFDDNANGQIDTAECVGLLGVEACTALDPDQDGLINDASLGVDAFYTAGGVVGDVAVTVDPAGDPQEFRVVAHDIPSTARLCFSKNEACSSVGRTEVEGMALLFDASAPMTVDAFLCLEPAGKPCGANSKNFTVTGLRFQDVRFEVLGSNEKPLTLFFDTEHDPATGQVSGVPVTGRFDLDVAAVLKFKGDFGDTDGDGFSGVDARLNLLFLAADLDFGPLPNGLVADQLKVEIPEKGDPIHSGGLECPAGFEANVKVRFLLFAVRVANFKDILCKA